MRLISRREAIEQGLKRYFTGKPCKHGHVAERGVRGGECKECDRIRGAKRQGYTVKPRRLEKASPIHITRAEAVELGHKTYFTGMPCSHGHVAERSVRNSNCVECSRVRKTDPEYQERESARLRARRIANPEARERIRAAKRQRRATDPEYRERIYAANRKWRAKQKALNGSKEPT